MAIIKCKMCGGDLPLTEGMTVCECEYCGTRQTIPKFDNEKKLNLYDRANHFRRNNEFDKAEGIYEKILDEDPTDAESYWSLVLCRYGIEYVEDPATHKRVPTVNRAQYTSIYADENYKKALEYSDTLQKTVYEAEAKAIDDIQKGILEISSKEEPFDVFICYKETDDQGRRTRDSVYATELYHALTDEGFKVFFSRITLEDKLGTAYEPYIFAALNSAKVMVVLGSKIENFNAVWVKNEWSRYLALIQSGAKKTLIPAYRDMDPYDLPEEFSHLQSQDMSKLGFLQDLVRGIKKIIGEEEPKAAGKETVVVSGGTDVAPLLKRAFIFLEDGNFTGADEYCERVLDQDPENARAYLGKLMAEQQVRKQEDLKDFEQPFDTSDNYQKAIRFGDDSLVSTLTGYINQINNRNETNRLTGIYNGAMSAMEAATTEEAFKAAAVTFRSISEFKDADDLANQCMEKAEDARKDAIYTSAAAKMDGEKAGPYETAIEEFRSISGWKDADEKVALCQRKIEEIKAKEEQARIEKEQKAEAARFAREQTSKKTKKILKVLIPVACVCIVFALVVTNVILPKQKLNRAMELLDAEDYDSAYALLEELGNNDVITASKHDRGVELLDAGEYEAAYTLLEQSGDKEIVASSKRERANSFLDSGDFDSAYALLEETGDSNTIKSSKYERAISYIDAKDYEAAVMLLQGLDYEDSFQKLSEILPLYYRSNMDKASVGDILYFGSYEQDNNTANGKEDIAWQVLAKENNRLFVISENALDCQQFNTTWTDVTWETCSLRTWLNDTFLTTAFTSEERTMIPSVTVTADANPKYSVSPGNNTQDKIFLLSVLEANRYFFSDSERQCKPTVYAQDQGCNVSDNGFCRWMLRTPGNGQDYNADISTDGSVHSGGYDVRGGNGAIRPAMWIDLED